MLQTHNNWMKIKTTNKTTYLYFNCSYTTNDYDLYEVAHHAFGHVFELNHYTTTKTTSNAMYPLPAVVKEKLGIHNAFNKPIQSKFLYFSIRFKKFSSLLLS